MKLITPNFLRRVDLFLLTHYPYIWATRAYYFLFYSLICGNLLLFLIGFLYPISIDNLPDYDTIVLFLDLWLLCGFLLSIYWIFLQIRDSKPLNTLKQIIITFFIYLLCLGSVVSNLLVFGGILNERVNRITDKNELYEDFQYYRTFSEIIDSLSEEMVYSEKRSQILDYCSSTQVEKNPECQFANFIDGLYRSRYFFLRFDDPGDLYNQESLEYFKTHLDTINVSEIVKKSLLVDIKKWNKRKNQKRFRYLYSTFPSPKSLTLSDTIVLKILEAYKIQDYSIIEYEDKMKNLFSYHSSGFCLVHGDYKGFYNSYQYGYSHDLDITFDIPERQKASLMALVYLVFSISVFTIILRSYKSKRIWIALLCVVAIFILEVVSLSSIEWETNNVDEIEIILYSFYLVFSLPVLIITFFCKKNGRITNIFLLIPLIFIFLWHFFIGIFELSDPNGIGIDTMWLFRFLVSSLFFVIIIFHSLLRINRLPG